MRIFLFIGTGSFIGGVSRYYISKLLQESIFFTLPIGTFTVNIVGSFLIGFFFGLSEKTVVDPEWRLLLTTGFCGSFTTFSTFANENLTYLRDGQFMHFISYTTLSMLFGLVAVYLGRIIVKLV